MMDDDPALFEARAERAMKDLEGAVEAVVRICDATDSLTHRVAMRTAVATLAASGEPNPAAHRALCEAVASDLREYGQALSSELPAYSRSQTDALAELRKLTDSAEADRLGADEVAGIVEGMQDYRDATNGGKAKVVQAQESIATLDGDREEMASARDDAVALLGRFAEALRCGAEEARLAQRAWKRVAARRSST